MYHTLKSQTVGMCNTLNLKNSRVAREDLGADALQVYPFPLPKTDTPF